MTSQTTPRKSAHQILAHSYLVYLLALLLGLLFYVFFPIKIFDQPALLYFGSVLLILATMLIFSAQKASKNFNRENVNKESFCHGPYCFTRSPTHWGLFILLLGFGIIINSFFVVVFTIASFLLTKFVFLRKEEKVLEEKYGAPYLEYKKIVRL